ncbi:MAG: hypothetical protein GX640_04085 [Fibrobacter sp.]|nr:hypothetical protein [Fibrobacter sp.]
MAFLLKKLFAGIKKDNTKRVSLIFLFLSISYGKTNTGLYYYHDIDFQLNNLGIASSAILYFQKPLFNTENILLKDTKIWSGPIIQASPTDVLLGIYLRFKPLSIFEVKVFGGRYFIFNQFGNFSGIKGLGYIPLNNISSEYDAETLSKIESSNKSGIWIRTKPVLQAQYKFIAFKTQFEIDYFNIDSPDEFYLNQQLSCRFKNNSVSLANTSFLLCEFSKNKYAGLYNYLYRNSGSDLKKHRVGITALFSGNILNGNNEYFLTAIAGYILKDDNFRNKPYIAISTGLIFNLWNSR